MAVQSRYSTQYEDTAPSGGVSDADILAYVTANINNPSAIASAAQQFGVSASDISRATGYGLDAINSYFTQAQVTPYWDTGIATLPTIGPTAATITPTLTPTASITPTVATVAPTVTTTPTVDTTTVTTVATTAPTTSITNAYFLANPDVAAAYTANSYGLTPQEFADAHYYSSGRTEGRSNTGITVTNTPTTVSTTTPTVATVTPTLATTTPTVATTTPTVITTTPTVTTTTPTVTSTPTVATVTPTVDTTSVTNIATTAPTSVTTSPTTKTYTQTEVNDALVNLLATDPNASRADITALAATLGITADQVNAAYANLSINKPTTTTTPTTATTTPTVVTTTPTVTTAPTTATTTPTASLTPTTTIYGRTEVDALNVPGYGVIAQTELQGWEPWRLQMWGITKNADNTFSYGGGPAWTTATGTTRTLYDQINNISNLQGMGGLYTGGALGKDDGGLGSKEAVLWDFTNKLAALGVTSLADIGRRMVTEQQETEQGTITVEREEIYNKKTGQAINIEGTTVGNNQTNYGFTFTNTGLAIPTTTGTKSDWVEFRDSVLPIVLSVVSIAYPAAAPYIQAFNAAKAAKDGDWMRAALSGLSAASGLAGSAMAEIDALANAGKFEEALSVYNNSWLAQNAGNITIARDVAGVVNSAVNNDVIGLVNAGVKYAGATLPTELRTGANLLNFGNAIINKDTTGILNAAGDLTRSNDLKLAAAANNYINAINNFNRTGNFSGIANATASFSNFIQNYSANTTTTPTTTASTTPTTDVITTLINNGLTETQIADANLFNTGERITLASDAQGVIDQLASIQPDEYAFLPGVAAGASAAATQTALLLNRYAATPAGQELLREAALVNTTVRDALIATGLVTAAGFTSFIAGNSLVPPKLQPTVTTTTNTGLVDQIPTDTIADIVNRNVTTTGTLKPTTTTTNPTTQVSTSTTPTYVVQPGDYSDTTEVVQPWQSINPTTQVAQPDASRLASMLGVSVDTAANLLRIYPSLFGEDESFTPADLETMTSTDIRLLGNAGGGADDNIITQQPSNDTVVARDSEGQPITYGDLVNIIGSNRVTTQPTVQATTTTQPTVTVSPTTSPTVTTEATTSPTVTTRATTSPTTFITTEVTTTPTTATTTKPTTVVTTETTPTTEVTTTVTPTTESTTKPTTATQTTVEPTTSTQTTTKPTTATQTTTTPTAATQTTTTPTTATQTTTKPTTATQTTTTPTAATQTTTTPTTGTQTTTTPTTATQTTTTPTTATQTTTTPTTATQTTVTPTTATQTTTTPTTATQTTTTPTTATQTTVEPTTATQTTTTPTPTVTVTQTPTPTTTVTQTPTPTATVTQTPTPTATVTQTPTPTIKLPTVNPTVASTVSGYTMPQAQNIAAAFGIPQLANVFYYGKDFSSKKQKLDKKGELEEEEYRPLSVTKAGAEGELMEEIAEEKKNKENNTDDALDLVLGKSSDSMSFDDLLNIVKGG